MNIKYLLKRSINNKNGYLLGIVIMCIVLLVGYFSFALFTTESEKKGALNIEVGNLHSLIESGDFDNQKQITVAPGEKKLFKIKLTNVNQLEAKFNLFYSSESDLTNVKIGYLPTGDIPPGVQGYTIKKYGSGEDTKTFEVMIYNSGVSAVTIKFDSHVGLKDKDLIFPSGMSVLEKYPIPTLRKRDDEYSTENYYAYASSITKIIFSDDRTIPSEAVESWDLSEAGDGSIAGYIIDDGLGTSTYQLYIQSETGQIYANEDSSYLFLYFNKLTSIDNLAYLNTSNTTNMNYIFSDCSSLSSLDVSNFDTSKVTNMQRMFYNCKSLTSIDVSRFDTSNVTIMQGMFYGCTSLTNLDVSNFNTRNVTSMANMFLNCNKLTILDVSNFNTSKVTTMYRMFYECRGVTSLDVSAFDTSKVRDMFSMFYECRSLTSLDLTGFNTSSVTTMESMFYGCRGLTNLDLSNFNTEKVTTMVNMFMNTVLLTQIKVSSSTWVMASNTTGMFSGSGVASLTYV